MPPQLVRLLLLLVAIVASYSLARAFLTPPSFGEYGWYRGKALVELTSYPRIYAGKLACDECHAEELSKLARFSHKNLSCEACHGPAQEHAKNPDVKLEKPHFGHCVRCHEANPARPKTHKQVVSREHYAGSKCTECHVPHAPSEVP
jgi:hypothetical protein